MIAPKTAAPTSSSSAPIRPATLPAPFNPAAKLLLDGTSYANKPLNLKTAGGRPFRKTLVNSWWLTRTVTVKPNGDVAVQDTDTLQQSGTQYLAKLAKEQGADFLVIDLEGDPLTIANCEKILGWLRAANMPKVQISFYDVLHGIGPYANSPQTLAYVDAENSRWAAFAKKLDFLTPSMYSGPSVSTAQDMRNWVNALEWSVAECHKFAPGKPVLPFLCPRFVDYPNYPRAIRGTMVPTAALSKEIAATLRVADGYVMWDPASILNRSQQVPANWTVAANSWWPAVQQN